MKGLFILIVAITIIIAVYAAVAFQKESFEERRARVLSDLSLAIDDAKAQGRYRCCIEPPCTMCYLGNWIWEDGSCYCDDMIMKGELDKVCPQCKSGGCESSSGETCEVT